MDLLGSLVGALSNFRVTWLILIGRLKTGSALRKFRLESLPFLATSMGLYPVSCLLFPLHQRRKHLRSFVGDLRWVLANLGSQLCSTSSFEDTTATRDPLVQMR